MKKKVLLLSFAILSIFANVNAQSIDATERAVIKIKSVFIYNFTLYIDWPESYKTGNFIVGIMLDKNNKAAFNAMYSELQNMAKTKKAGTQIFKIIRFEEVNDITKCHILYVPSGVSNQLSDIIKHIDTNGFNTLIVTDKEGLAKKGAAVNFVRIDNRQKFELNEANTTKYQLKLAARFKNLAIIVE